MDNEYELYALIRRGDREGLKQLLASDPKLCQARPYGQSLALLAVLENQTGILEDLIANGCDLNDGDDERGLAPLHAAALNDRVEAARLLLAHGARVEAEDRYGDTPLYRAVYAYQGNPEMVKLLLEHGADPAHENQHGVSPLSVADTKQDAQLVRLLRTAMNRGG
jgi:ankyrin repeat protein